MSRRYRPWGERGGETLAAAARRLGLTLAALRLHVVRLDAAGASYERIAAEIGVCRDRVARMLDYTLPAGQAVAVNARRRPRRCLRHGGEFVSDGPGHRVCDDCKKRPEWRCPPTVGSIAGRERR